MESQSISLIRSIATTITVLALAACSGEPSSIDIENSTKALMKETSQELMKAGYKNLVPTMHSVRKIGCAPAKNEAGYICDVEFDVSSPMTGRVKDIEKRRFVKSDSGWIIVGNKLK